jgi:membrane protein
MDPLAPLHRFDDLQQRHPALAFPLAVVRKYGNDQAGLLVAVISYRAFLSVFPLLLVFTTVLGYVLHGDAQAQRSVLHSALGQFPIIGQEIKVRALTGNGLGLAVGIAGSLWGGLGVTLAAQTAMDTVWAVPFKRRPDFLFSRLRGLAMLAALGALNVVSSGVSGVVSGGLGGAGLRVAGIATSLVLNLLLFLAAFRLLTSKSVATRDLLPGVLIAALLWEILQAVGGYYVGHVVRGATPTYGTFALIIGLVAWIHLGAQATLYAAEANVVRRRHLWPRSLFGIDRPEDERTLRGLAKIEERDERETVEATFD